MKCGKTTGGGAERIPVTNNAANGNRAYCLLAAVSRQHRLPARLPRIPIGRALMQMTAAHYREEVMTEMEAHLLLPEDRVLLHRIRRHSHSSLAAARCGNKDDKVALTMIAEVKITLSRVVRCRFHKRSS